MIHLLSHYPCHYMAELNMISMANALYHHQQERLWALVDFVDSALHHKLNHGSCGFCLI